MNGSNDVFYTTLSPGQSWDITTSTGHVWRAIETGEGFNNQLFDQSYTVTKECDQTWFINPAFCTFANNGGGTTGTTSTCTPKLVHYQGFESGWGQWTDGGSDCARNYEPSLNTVGNYCVQLRDNSNVASSTVTTRLNFTSVQEVKVDFMYIAESMEHGEDFMLEYSTNDGATYTTVKSWKSGTDFFNGETKTESVSFTGNFNSTTKLRFRCDASTNYDFVYLDEISIYACGGAWLDDDSGTQYSTSQSGAVDMDFNNESATAATTIEVAVTEDTTPAAEALKIYPIPATHTITIDGLNGQTYDVYNISGQRIIKASNDQVLDISDLQNGTYVLRTIDGQMMRFNKI